MFSILWTRSKSSTKIPHVPAVVLTVCKPYFSGHLRPRADFQQLMAATEVQHSGRAMMEAQLGWQRGGTEQPHGHGGEPCCCAGLLGDGMGEAKKPIQPPVWCQQHCDISWALSFVTTPLSPSSPSFPAPFLMGLILFFSSRGLQCWLKYAGQLPAGGSRKTGRQSRWTQQGWRSAVFSGP